MCLFICLLGRGTCMCVDVSIQNNESHDDIFKHRYLPSCLLSSLLSPIPVVAFLFVCFKSGRDFVFKRCLTLTSKTGNTKQQA